MTKENINSDNWWNEYFKNNSWKQNHGCEQTFFFSRHLIKNLPAFLKDEIVSGHYSICDIGCACGENVYALHKIFKGCAVSGIDVSESAIEQAKKQFPDLKFECVRIADICEQYDVCICSNVLEHFQNPYEQLYQILPHCKKYFIVMVPYLENPMDWSHEYCFTESDFKGGGICGFEIAAKIVIDLSKEEHTYWHGKQIIVIYRKSLKNMHQKENGRPDKELWDKVSEDYLIEISDEEAGYAEEIASIFLKAEIEPPSKILELGSGSGHLSACLAQKGYQVSLLDFSKGALDKSKETFAAYGLKGTFIEGDLMDLGGISREYDLVWNSGVMEHFDDENLRKVFCQIAAVMKDKFLFLVPNPESVAYLLMRYNLEGNGEWSYGQEFLRSNYLDLAKDAGLHGKILGFAASDISVWHFESTLPLDKNNRMYAALVKDGLMPPNESYLTAYLVEKNETSEAVNTGRDQESQKPNHIEPEKYFKISAENFRLKQNFEHSKEEAVHYKAEAERLLEANKVNENQLSEKISTIRLLENEKVRLQERNAVLDQEKERLQREKEGLQWEKEGLQWEKEALQREKVALLQDKEKNKEHEAEESYAVLRRERDELRQEKEAVWQQLAHIQTQILPQAFYATEAVRKILNAKGFGMFIRLHAALGAIKREPAGRKVRIAGKLLLRIAGIRKPLHIEGYRMDLQIEQYLRNIEHIVEISRISNGLLEKESCKSAAAEIKDLPVETKECLYAREPLISVLMPVYNHAAFVSDAIQAVQRQTYTNWELILLNDGSTDGLLDQITDYCKDPRIRIYTQDNQRLPNALTNLHNLADGEFITWTSADNVMEEDMLKQLAEKLLASPQAVMVYADVSIIDENGGFVTAGYREMNRDREFPYRMRLPHCAEALNAETDNFINACFLYRAKPVKALQGLYAADLEGLEDYDFWLRLRTFGGILHVNNEKPLYRYRVHKNTMSEELLTNKQKEHAKRAEQMIAYSRRKDAFSEKSWNIRIEQKAPGAEIFRNSLLKLNYAYQEESEKSVLFTDKPNLERVNEGQPVLTYEEKAYHIYVKENGTCVERANIYRGYDISPLAKKVRQTFINGLFWEYPAEYAGMQALGCHMDLRHIHVGKTITLLQQNPDILFSFCMLENTLSEKKIQQMIKQIQEACGNVIFMGEREFGSQLYLYASWDAAFIPPLKADADLMPMILLGWNIGKWIYVEEQNLHASLPFVSPYYYGEKLLGMKSAGQNRETEEALDQYIEMYSSAGAARQVIRYLNGIGQDLMVKRPDFQLPHKERKFPPLLVEKKRNVPESLKSGYLAIMADRLDKGGLEQVAALLARKFTECGLKIVLFCTQEGGQIAQELAEEGIEIEIFHGDEQRFETYICEHRPILINTHYTRKMLDIAARQNIPVIDVIHNMYVFQDARFFQKEKEMCGLFTKMIAVSSIAKEVYVKKVNADPDRIEVIGNAANPDTAVGLNRQYIRELFGISQNAFVFLNVSSIDSRKNQLGLVKAFEIFHQKAEKNSYLILAGNVLSDFYDRELEAHIAMGTCQEHILKLAYHKKIGDLYQAADVFVMNSYFEGWSIAATEALYCGLPVIHSMCGSARELLGDGENGILIPNPAGEITRCSHEQLMDLMSRGDSSNMDELVSAMMRVYKNREAWREKRRKISAESMMRWNEDDMIEQYLRVFEKCIKHEF